MDKLFPLAEAPQGGAIAGNLRAVYTGETRPPRKGEWYLSGAIIEAWQASMDFDQAYPIARIVRVKVRTVVDVLGPWLPGEVA